MSLAVYCPPDAAREAEGAPVLISAHLQGRYGDGVEHNAGKPIALDELLAACGALPRNLVQRQGQELALFRLDRQALVRPEQGAPIHLGSNWANGMCATISWWPT